MIDEQRLQDVATRWNECDREPALELIREQPTAAQGAYLALRIVHCLEESHYVFDAFMELQRELTEFVEFERGKTIPCEAWVGPMHVED